MTLIQRRNNVVCPVGCYVDGDGYIVWSWIIIWVTPSLFSRRELQMPLWSSGISWKWMPEFIISVLSIFCRPDPLTVSRGSMLYGMVLVNPGSGDEHAASYGVTSSIHEWSTSECWSSIGVCTSEKTSWGRELFPPIFKTCVMAGLSLALVISIPIIDGVIPSSMTLDTSDMSSDVGCR